MKNYRPGFGKNSKQNEHLANLRLIPLRFCEAPICQSPKIVMAVQSNS